MAGCGPSPFGMLRYPKSLYGPTLVIRTPWSVAKSVSLKRYDLDFGLGGSGVEFGENGVPVGVESAWFGVVGINHWAPPC